MSASIEFRRENNEREVQVSRSKFSSSGEILQIESAVLEPCMYDATTISISGKSDLKLEDLWFELTEVFDIVDRKMVNFNMYTRESEDGTDCWNERIFYGSSLVVNTESGALELTIYIPHRCKNGSVSAGYLDSVVQVSFEDDVPVFKSWRTKLPPTVVNGVPFKRNPNQPDPVIPSNASRVNFGVDTVPSYYENSLNLNEDYLFTNSAPLYSIEASGYLPTDISGDFTFSGTEAYMRNDVTSMSAELDISSSSVTSETVDVMAIDGISGPFRETFDVYKWQYDLISEATSAYSGSLHSTAWISSNLVAIV